MSMCRCMEKECLPSPQSARRLTRQITINTPDQRNSPILCTRISCITWTGGGVYTIVKWLLNWTLCAGVAVTGSDIVDNNSSTHKREQSCDNTSSMCVVMFEATLLIVLALTALILCAVCTIRRVYCYCCCHRAMGECMCCTVHMTRRRLQNPQSHTRSALAWCLPHLHATQRVNCTQSIYALSCRPHANNHNSITCFTWPHWHTHTSRHRSTQHYNGELWHDGDAKRTTRQQQRSCRHSIRVLPHHHRCTGHTKT
jgi:hypothetical protein